MATWVAPIDSQTDPDAPLTSELGKRWDNNVIAAFEGAAGAPRLRQRVLAQYATSADTSFAVPSGYGGFYFSGGSSGGSGDTVIAFSDDNGSTYAADNTISIGSLARGYVDLTTGEYFSYTGGGTVNGTFTMPAGTVDRFILRAGGEGKPVSTGGIVEFTGRQA